MDLIVAKRESLVERLSPAARHRAFPTIYARPLPKPDTAAELVREVARLMADNRRLTEANRALRNQVTAMSVDLERVKPVGDIPGSIEPKSLTVAEVLNVFIDALASAGFLVDGRPLAVADITSPRKARRLTPPRHVAMWLCYSLIKGSSLPKIGHQFGGRDHSTIFYGTNKAAEWMEESPLLRATALAVLAHFDETREVTP